MKYPAFRSFTGRALSVLLPSVSVLFSVTVSALAQSATHVSPENFSFYVPFTVTGYAGSAALESFPVLVRLADNSPTAFHYTDCAADGSDLRFADSSGSLIPHEIDTWDATGESLVWVRVPVLSNSATFRMYYGSVAPGATAAEDVWSRYAVVIHGGSSVANSVAGGPVVSIGNATAVAANAAAGKAGGGIRKNTAKAIGVNVAMENPAALADTGKFSISGWFKRDGKGGKNNGTHVLSGSRRNWNSNGDDGYLLLQEQGKYIDVAARGSHQWTSGTYTLEDQTWGHVAFSYEKDVAIKSYFNGNADQTKTSPGNLVSSGSTWTFGSYANTASDDSFKGDMDELRIFDGVASGDWIKAEHDTVASASFLTAGQATPCVATPAPQVGVVASDVQYTNATFSVTVGSLGKNVAMTADASWVDATLLVAAEDTFASTLFSIPLARVSTAPVTVSATAVPLATNTTYYVKVVAANSFNATGESGTVPFTTRSPGAPAGAALLQERGFTTLSANATATSFGIGAESATMRLEASADGFATVIAGAEAAAVLDAATSLSVSGLAANTEYALRVRIRNDWGLDTFVALSDAATRSVPFATTGIGWTFSQDGSAIAIDFGVSGVYDGATGSAALTYNGQTVAPAQAVSGAGTLTWPAISAANGTATATVVLSATLGGQTYSQTFTAAIAPGSAAVSVTDIADHLSAAAAVRVHPGDVVTLPELSGSAFYIVGNKLFGSLSGNVLTALRPGILGIHCVTSGGATTNTLPVIILPEKIGNGDIYIYKESVVGTGNGLWHNASYWEKVGSETNNSYPHNEDDIAIIPFYRLEGNKSINLGGDVSLGALYFGFFRDISKGATGNLGTNNSQYKRHITFSRTDDEPALVQICSNSTANDRRVTLGFSNATAVSYEDDAVVSGGWDGTDQYMTQGRLSFGDNTTNTIPEGVTLTFVEFDTQGTSNSQTFKLRYIVGGGTVWNRSAANIKLDASDGLAAFTGLLRDSSCGNRDCGRSGPILVRTPSATNALYELVGFVAQNGSGHPQQESTSSVGRFYTGWEPGFGSTYYGETNWFPGRGLVMHGGTHYSRATEKYDTCPWSVGERERKVGAKLTLADGFNYLYETSRENKDGHPINWLEYNALDHENKSTLLVRDPSRMNAPVQAYTNVVTIFHGISEFMVGPAGDPELSDSYPTVPWIVSPLDGGNSKVYFSAFDSADRLVRPALAADNTALSAFSAGRNAYCRNAGIALTNDLTVNSLYLQNDTKGKTLGAGRTLTVTSGGLILSDVDDKNNPGAAAIGEEGGSENGALVLGNADHPAYVWAFGATTSSANTAPNQIWAAVTAPGGFVAAYTGHLVLGGDQIGIGDELVVNAGTLQLGTAMSGCSLAKDLPIRVFANATLALPHENTLAGTVLQFDGAAGWFGKAALATNQRCRRLYVRDYPEAPEWQNLPRGTYGSSESAAEFVRDDLFTGTGVLTVASDDQRQPTVINLR